MLKIEMIILFLFVTPPRPMTHTEFYPGVFAEFHFTPDVRADFGGTKWNLGKNWYVALEDKTLVKANQEGRFEPSLTRQQIKYIGDSLAKMNKLDEYVIIKNGLTEKAGWYIKHRPDGVLNTPSHTGTNQKECWVFKISP
jgi:hypothetical protein